jgi:cytidylate kinase
MASETALPPVITVDGPSGTGKGTLALRLARQLGWHFLDSGALYRSAALGAEAAGIAYGDTAALCAFAARMEVAFSTVFEGSILLNGVEISDQVRLEESGAKASVVAAIPEVRAALLQRQRDFRRAPGLVADGRDMGTVVFTDAALKFYLTASAEERAHRRYKQLINKGVGVSLRSLFSDIRARDERDSTRAVAPLRPAQDAVIVATDELTADEVFALATRRINEVLGSHGL